MKFLSRSIRNALLNSVSDTAVLFSAGSAVMAAPVSKTAMGINIGRAALCFATRLTTELEKANITLPVPGWFRSYAKNKGASLMTASAITATAAGFALSKANPLTPETYLPAASMGMFAFSHFALGFGAGRKEGKLKTIFSALGMAASNTGLCMTAGPGTPAPVYTAFVASAASALRLAFKGASLPQGLAQPEFYAAAGCAAAAVNAFATGQPVWGVTNLLYGAGFVTLRALKTDGGIMEWLGAGKKPDLPAFNPL